MTVSARMRANENLNDASLERLHTVSTTLWWARVTLLTWPGEGVCSIISKLGGSWWASKQFYSTKPDISNFAVFDL